MINETISLQDQTLFVDLAARRVWQGDAEVELTRLEYEVLACLSRRAGCVITYGELWQKVWSEAEQFGCGEEEVVRAVIKRLRRKLGDNAELPKYIVCARGVGVRLRRRALYLESQQ